MDEAAAILGRAGGRARAERLSPERRAEIARKAAEARWGHAEVNVRPMSDPNYRYSPWTPERRKAASEKAKRRWAEKKTREAEKRFQEELQWHREQQGALGQVRTQIKDEARKMEAARVAYFNAKARMEQLQGAEQSLVAAIPTLRRFKIVGHIG